MIFHTLSGESDHKGVRSSCFVQNISAECVSDVTEWKPGCVSESKPVLLMGNKSHLILLFSSVKLKERFLFLKAFLLTLILTTIKHSFIHFISSTPKQFRCALSSGRYPQSYLHSRVFNTVELWLLWGLKWRTMTLRLSPQQET